MFDAVKGLVHFTFANEDTYFKKSLMVLDRQKNLYYELKKNFYKTVVFIDIVDNNYRITCADGKAEALYNECQQNVFSALGAWFSDGNAIEPHKSVIHTISREKKNALIAMLSRMMTKSDHTAFVFSIETMASFQAIFSAQKMIEEQRDKYAEKRNLILVVSDTQLNVSLDKLTNPDGIFQTSAFPEIREICQNYKNARLYELMKQKMPERVSYLNAMNKDELRSLVTWSVMKLGTNLKERMSRLDDYTDFIYLMTHSAIFASKMKMQYPALKDIFTENETRLFSVLQRNVSTDKAYEHMDLIIAEIRANHSEKDKKLIDLVQVYDDGKKYQMYLYQNEYNLQRILSLAINQENRKSDVKKKNEDYVREINEKLDKVRKEIIKPHIISDKKKHDELQTFISYCIDAMNNAKIHQDYETMKLGADALVYAICNCEQEKKADSNEGKGILKNGGQDLCMKAYERVLEAQGFVGEQKRKILSYVGSLQKLNADATKIDQEIKSLKKMYPDIEDRAKNLDDYSMLVEEYRSLVQESVSIDQREKAIKSNMKLITMNLEAQRDAITAWQNQINTIQDSAYTMTVADYDFSITELDEATQEIMELRKKIKGYFDDLEKSKSAVVIDAQTQSVDEKIDAKFDAKKALDEYDLEIDFDLEESVNQEATNETESSQDAFDSEKFVFTDDELYFLDNEN